MIGVIAGARAEAVGAIGCLAIRDTALAAFSVQVALYLDPAAATATTTATLILIVIVIAATLAVLPSSMLYMPQVRVMKLTRIGI